MSLASDPELIEQLQVGSLEALGELYDRHRQMVYRTALVITGDREAASDLMQDVFLRLFRFAGRIDRNRPLEPWLYRMTTNLSYSWIKRNPHWLHSLEDLADWLVGTGKSALHEQVEQIDESARVQQAVAALPIPQRLVVILYYLNDLPLHEIAEILDVPLGTVKSRLHYGRLALKLSLGLNGEGLPGFKYESS